ncbi:MAG: carbohydrate-binding family 9-like protein [Flavisolibacter sp.]
MEETKSALVVPYLQNCTAGSDYGETEARLDELERQLIGAVSWPAFPYKPQVQFVLAHRGDALLLKFFVCEECVRIEHQEDNSAVYEDSCVEFFIAFDGEESYYNFEFNAAGTCLAQFGKNRRERWFIDAEQLHKISRNTHMNNKKESGTGEANWQLTLVIPLEVFSYHQLSNLKSHTAAANFYKCGDALPQKHFLSWKKIISPEPDFHLRQFFGDVIFE